MPRGIKKDGTSNAFTDEMREKAKTARLAKAPKRRIEKLLKEIEAADVTVLDEEIKELQAKLASAQNLRATILGLKTMADVPPPKKPSEEEFAKRMQTTMQATADKVTLPAPNAVDPNNVQAVMDLAHSILIEACRPMDLHNLSLRVGVPKALLEKLLAKDDRFEYTVRGYAAR